MKEIKLPDALTRYFAAHGIRLYAETWRGVNFTPATETAAGAEALTEATAFDNALENTASSEAAAGAEASSEASEIKASSEALISLVGTKNTVRVYIDGTSLAEYGFEVRLRVRADSVRDRLDAMSFFERVNEAVKACREDDFSLEISSGVSKSAIYENGDEEYRASYKIICFSA